MARGTTLVGSRRRLPGRRIDRRAVPAARGGRGDLAERRERAARRLRRREEAAAPPPPPSPHPPDRAGRRRASGCDRAGRDRAAPQRRPRDAQDPAPSNDIITLDPPSIPAARTRSPSGSSRGSSVQARDVGARQPARGDVRAVRRRAPVHVQAEGGHPVPRGLRRGDRRGRQVLLRAHCRPDEADDRVPLQGRLGGAPGGQGRRHVRGHDHPQGAFAPI